MSDHGTCAARALTSLRNRAYTARQLSVGLLDDKEGPQRGNYMEIARHSRPGSKAVLDYYSRTLAVELALSGIPLDVVSPGVIMMRIGSE